MEWHQGMRNSDEKNASNSNTSSDIILIGSLTYKGSLRTTSSADQLVNTVQVLLIINHLWSQRFWSRYVISGCHGPHPERKNRRQKNSNYTMGLLDPYAPPGEFRNPIFLNPPACGEFKENLDKSKKLKSCISYTRRKNDVAATHENNEECFQSN